MRLSGKVAIVTGAAHGMGAEEARLFAREGAKVVVADLLVAEDEAVAASIRQANGDATFVKLDVTSDTEWEAAIAATIAAYGRLDILVNNAGISGSSVGDPDGVAGWDRVIAINATSVFLGTRRAAKEMAKTGGARSSIFRPSWASSVAPIVTRPITPPRPRCATTRRPPRCATAR